jgi:hypothetical protein
MFLTLLTLAAVLGFFLGPVWLVFIVLLAVASKLFPAVILLAVICALIAGAFHYFKRK